MFEPELAQAILMDHYRAPHHKGSCEEVSESGDTTNPMCGDEITVTLTVDGGAITCARFDGQGCAVSQAGASLVMDLIQEQSVVEARTRLNALIASMAGDELSIDLDTAAALLAVRENPARTVCATLTAKLVLGLLEAGK